jgi:hypothetical protein
MRTMKRKGSKKNRMVTEEEENNVDEEMGKQKLTSIIINKMI